MLTFLFMQQEGEDITREEDDEDEEDEDDYDEDDDFEDDRQRKKRRRHTGFILEEAGLRFSGSQYQMGTKEIHASM